MRWSGQQVNSEAPNALPGLARLNNLVRTVRTPGTIAALAGSGTPLSNLTKGTLLRRDLALLTDANEHVPVDIGMSIAIYDDELQQSVEPGTPTAKARLATVTAVRDAGGTSIVYSALHLKPGTKEWYFQWLEGAHPELVERYRSMYARGTYAPGLSAVIGSQAASDHPTSWP